ncbi:MAG: hypothetical protein ACFB2X_17910 [Rivularia sp. (in: cyanobacteria)]
MSQLKSQNFRETTQTCSRSQEAAFQMRSLAIQEKLAGQNLDGLDAWWRRRKIQEPHKYLLPAILAQLSLGNQYNTEQIWTVLLNLNREKSDLYHFRSVFDVRIFLMFRKLMPQELIDDYHSMLDVPRVREWSAPGTENHMFMQRLSGLALMDGSGYPNACPSTAATNEAWLRAELNKFLTIGQGEFNSSTYYGYSIGGLLNLYDFARTPHLRQLAKGGLDWYATNIALRFSWGTVGGAESRGYDRGTWIGSRLAAIAWIWWGEDAAIAENARPNHLSLALLAGLSNYRPPDNLKALALKEVSLPFVLRASHPGYYSYHKGNQFWETFYVTEDYSLGTLLVPQRSYQIEGTINAQYATYKLVVRDPRGLNNAVVSLGGTFHHPTAKGCSPGDQYLQERGTVIYQLRLNEQDLAAGVPPRSHLVLPASCGQPMCYGNWYIWKIEAIWLCVYPWGETISLQALVSKKDNDFQALAAIGSQTAWITDIATVADYPDFRDIKNALDKAQVDDEFWEQRGELAYTSLSSDRLVMTYNPNRGIGYASVNGKERVLQNWPVLDSIYVKQELNSGVLSVCVPAWGSWHLRATLREPQWEYL